jgi:hypothetical protein
MNPIDIFIMNYNTQRPTTDSLVQGSIHYPRQTNSAFELNYRHPVNIIEDEFEQRTIIYPEVNIVPLRQTADYPPQEMNAMRLTNPDSIRLQPTNTNIIGSDEATDNETDDDTDTDTDTDTELVRVVTPSAPRPMSREQVTTTIEQIAFRLSRRTSIINTNNVRSNIFGFARQ